MEKSEFAGLTYPELVQVALDAEKQYEEAKAISNQAEANVRFIKRVIIPERMQNDRITNITVTLKNGDKKQLIILPQVSVKTPEEKRTELWQWLRDHGAESLITETVNSSTLAGYIRTQIKEGLEIPHDICDIESYDVASIRKG